MADAIKCSHCKGEFNPRDILGKNGVEYFHLGNQPGGFFAGYVDDNHRVIHQFANRQNLAANILRDGIGRTADLSKFPPQVKEF